MLDQKFSENQRVCFNQKVGTIFHLIVTSLLSHEMIYYTWKHHVAYCAFNFTKTTGILTILPVISIKKIVWQAMK